MNNKTSISGITVRILATRILTNNIQKAQFRVIPFVPIVPKTNNYRLISQNQLTGSKINHKNLNKITKKTNTDNCKIE
jgi:hypothetical protein